MTARLALAALLLSAGLSGQYSFGKNKVMYKAIRWKVTSTVHFDLYHDAAFEPFMERTARIVEASAVRLSKLYGHTPVEPMPIVIYPTARDFANGALVSEVLDEGTGGFTEFEKNRVVVPFTGSWEDFRHVLEHEIGHAFQLAVMASAGESARGGRAPSLWIMEGLAEYGSLGDDPVQELYARDGILTVALANLRDLENPWSLGARSYYVYKGAQGFFVWLSKKYGDKAPGEFFQRVVRLQDSDQAFRDLTGKGLDEINREWFYDLRTNHWPSIARKAEPELRDRRVTASGFDGSSFNLRPVFGRTNSKLYYISNKKIYAQIVENDLEKETIRTLASAEQTSMMESINILNNSLSLDGSRSVLSFTSRTGNRFLLHRYDLEKRRLLGSWSLPEDFTQVFQSAISPDGKRVAFSATRTNQIDLFVWDGVGPIRALTADAFSEGDPAWSPDGKTLAYVANRSFGLWSFRRALFLRDVETGREAPVETLGVNARSPQWSPDGRLMAYAAGEAGEENLVLRNLADGAEAPLTRLIGQVESLAFSSDGKQIVYAGFSDGVHDVYVHTLASPSPFLATNRGPRLPGERSESLRLALERETRQWPEPESKRALTLSVKSYLPRLSPDFLFFSAGGSSLGGISAGGSLTLSDLLGESRVGMQGWASFDPSSLQFDGSLRLDYRSLRDRLQLGISSFFWQQNYRSVATNALSPGFAERSFGAGLLAVFPLSKYARFEGSLVPSYFQREYRGELAERVTNLYPQRIGFTPVARLAWVFDNALYGMLHPVDNSRAMVSLEGGPSVGTPSYFRAIADGRHYFLIGRSSSIALRLMAGGVVGGEGHEFAFKVGGSGFFDLLSYTGENYPTLRSVPAYSLIGNHMHLFNFEYRFQFLDHVAFTFPFPFTIGRLNAVAFFDVGSAFDDYRTYVPLKVEGARMTFLDLRASLGFGLRFLFLVFPMKLDFSTPWSGHSLREPKDWDVTLTIGLDF